MAAEEVDFCVHSAEVQLMSGQQEAVEVQADGSFVQMEKPVFERLHRELRHDVKARGKRSMPRRALKISWGGGQSWRGSVKLSQVFCSCFSREGANRALEVVILSKQFLRPAMLLSIVFLESKIGLD